MSKITDTELKRINEPCKFCKIIAYGAGKDKEIHCDLKKCKLIGDWGNGWSQLSDCPKKLN